MSQLNKNDLTLIGVAALVAGGAALIDVRAFMEAYLFGFIFWAMLAAGCLSFLMLHHLVGGEWGRFTRRIFEAGAATLPFLLLLSIPILADLHGLYSWAGHHDHGVHAHVLAKKAIYLNVPFFIARTLAYFVAWSALAIALRRWSIDLDRTGENAYQEKMTALSAPGLLILFLTATFAAIDWGMSLEPLWFSSIYGAMLIVGGAITALALAIIVAVRHVKTGALEKTVSPKRLHDLGNLLFAFVLLWAYMGFSQFLIIWSGNLPEEVGWYAARGRGGWEWVLYGIVVLHGVVPFFLLLIRENKRIASRLQKIAYLVFGASAFSFLWLISPAFHPAELTLHAFDILVPVAVGAAWWAIFSAALRAQPMTLKTDVVGADE